MTVSAVFLLSHHAPREWVADSRPLPTALVLVRKNNVPYTQLTPMGMYKSPSPRKIEESACPFCSICLKGTNTSIPLQQPSTVELLVLSHDHNHPYLTSDTHDSPLTCAKSLDTAFGALKSVHGDEAFAPTHLSVELI